MSEKKNDMMTLAAAVAAFKLPERIAEADIPHSFTNGCDFTLELTDEHVSSREEAIDLFAGILKANPSVCHALFCGHEGEYSLNFAWRTKSCDDDETGKEKKG